VLNYVLQLRLKYEGQILNKPVDDFFEALVTNFQQRLQFDLKYPVFGALSYKVLQEQHEDVRPTQIELKRHIVSVLTALLEDQQRRGFVRADIDTRLMAHSIFVLQSGMYDYLASRFGIDIRANIQTHKPVLELTDEQVSGVARELVALVKSGIIRKNDEL
jgi:AcrR family transcriptional regulator